MNAPAAPLSLAVSVRVGEGADDAAGGAAARADRVAPARTPTRYDSQMLFGAAVEVEIVHQQQVYRLRRTAQGKLILTK